MNQGLERGALWVWHTPREVRGDGSAAVQRGGVRRGHHERQGQVSEAWILLPVKRRVVWRPQQVVENGWQGQE